MNTFLAFQVWLTLNNFYGVKHLKFYYALNKYLQNVEEALPVN